VVAVELAPVVAVINMHVEIVDMLQMALQDEGFRTVGKTIPELERGDQSLLNFLDEHNPRVIIYDVSPPYPQNWERFQVAREVALFKGRQVVLTTTDQDALERLIGPTEVYPIFSKPFELNTLMQAIRQIVEDGGAIQA
jgi:DNA-binding NtrC family response regulator